MVKAIGYSRVSSEEQAERDTIELQREHVRTWAARNEVELVRTYEDENASGTLFLHERPAAARLLQDAPELRKAGVSHVLLYRWDRFARKPWVLWDGIYRLEEAAGLRLRSVTQEADTSTPERLLLLCVDSGVSNMERESLLARQRDALRIYAAQGSWLGGPRAPYGYRVIGQRRQARLAPADEPIPGLVPAISEAEVIRTLFELAAEPDWSCERLAEYLNGLRVPTAYAERDYVHGRSGRRLGRQWTGEGVRQLLASTTYKGVRVFGKRGTRVGPVPQAVPPLVTEEQWAAAEAAREKRRLFSHRWGTNTYLLRGLIRCGWCGLTYHGWQPASKYGYYVCHGKRKGRGSIPGRCPSRNLPRSIEEEVWEQIEGALANRERTLTRLAERLRSGSAETRRTESEQERLRGALAEKQAERQRVVSWARTGLITEADLEQQLRELTREEEALRGRLRHAEGELARGERIAQEVQAAGAILDRYAAELREGLTAELKREVVEGFIEQIDVSPEGVSVRWRF